MMHAACIVQWNLDSAAERALIQQQFAAITVIASSNQDAVVAAKQNSSRQPLLDNSKQASNENEHDTRHEQSKTSQEIKR
ncbi:hypothetical protein RHGRI_010811 [Rhododendron griersonianum]|uniref:Uncharacterized protein n=1 Tax=Rhododendron griersonianum TaxID=479676 RepID=A0AAV6KKA5_9ERIC|nr:hypothetical protein RHGRI_010811 [Rhododendron griersonianum]